LCGALVARGVDAAVDGDAQLRRRSMTAVASALATMTGGPALTLTGAGLPARVHGGAAAGRLARGEGARVVELAPASAQIKGALLFAAGALPAGAAQTVREAAPTRGHTELFLRSVGVPVERVEHGWRAPGGARWDGVRRALPGDPSAAALLAMVAVLRRVPLSFDNVLTSYQRTGFFSALHALGLARTTWGHRSSSWGEPVGTLTLAPLSRARTSSSAPVVFDAAQLQSMIDEVPALALCAALARAPLSIEGVSVLRGKESDRVASTSALVAAFGGVATTAEAQRADGGVWRVRPGGAAPARARVSAAGDHRIAMAALSAGRALEVPLQIDDTACIGKSFRDFQDVLTVVDRLTGGRRRAGG
jgi:3-phosphoshikimate 1-carboxyvinyltransferase